MAGAPPPALRGRDCGRAALLVAGQSRRAPPGDVRGDRRMFTRVPRMEVGATGERSDDEACRRITAALKIMLIKLSSDIASSEISDKSQYLNRRQFLTTVGMATATGAAGLLSSETLVASSGATHGKKLANVVKS